MRNIVTILIAPIVLVAGVLAALNCCQPPAGETVVPQPNNDNLVDQTSTEWLVKNRGGSGTPLFNHGTQSPSSFMARSVAHLEDIDAEIDEENGLLSQSGLTHEPEPAPFTGSVDSISKISKLPLNNLETVQLELVVPKNFSEREVTIELELAPAHVERREAIQKPKHSPFMSPLPQFPQASAASHVETKFGELKISQGTFWEHEEDIERPIKDESTSKKFTKAKLASSKRAKKIQRDTEEERRRERKKEDARLEQMNYQINPNWWVDTAAKPQMPGRTVIPTPLDEVIFIALQNSPTIKVLNTEPLVQHELVQQQITGFDWAAFVESAWAERDEPTASALDIGQGSGLQRFQQKQWTFEAGLRKLATNGGEFRVGQSLGTLDNNSTFLAPPNQGNSQLVIDYRQPLLRGAGRDIATSQVALAKTDLQNIDAESVRQIQAHLIEVVTAYWTIYLRRADLVQLRESLNRGEALLQNLYDREDIDVTKDQILRAEAAVGQRRSDLIRAEFDLVNAQDVLLNLTVGPNFQHADVIEIIPEMAPLPFGFELDHQQLVQVAMHNRPEIQAATSQIRAATIGTNLAANQLLPQLDAILSTTATGVRGDRDVGGSFVDQFRTGNPGYSVGFSFEIPLGNRFAKSVARQAQLEMQIALEQFNQSVADVVLDARTSVRTIQRLNLEVKNNFQALQKAAEELNLIYQRQQLNLDDNKTGSLYVEDLLASQSRLTAAEQRLASSQTEQAIAILDLKRATGELLREGNREIVHSDTGIAPQLIESLPLESSTQGEPWSWPERTPEFAVTDSTQHPREDGFLYPNESSLPDSTIVSQRDLQTSIESLSEENENFLYTPASQTSPDLNMAPSPNDQNSGNGFLYPGQEPTPPAASDLPDPFRTSHSSEPSDRFLYPTQKTTPHHLTANFHTNTQQQLEQQQQAEQITQQRIAQQQLEQQQQAEQITQQRIAQQQLEQQQQAEQIAQQQPRRGKPTWSNEKTALLNQQRTYPIASNQKQLSDIPPIPATSIIRTPQPRQISATRRFKSSDQSSSPFLEQSLAQEEAATIKRVDYISDFIPISDSIPNQTSSVSWDSDVEVQ